MNRKGLPAIMRLIFAALIGLVVSTGAWALDPNEMFDDADKERRARDIGRSLRCVVCQNQSIFDSNAGIAHDLRMLVRERMDAGDSDDEIVSYIAARYGDYVLLKPPVGRHTIILWIAPVVFVVAGLGIVFAYRRRKDAAGAAIALSPDERMAARQILDGDRT